MAGETPAIDGTEQKKPGNLPVLYEWVATATMSSAFGCPGRMCVFKGWMRSIDVSDIHTYNDNVLFFSHALYHRNVLSLHTGVMHERNSNHT